jgi:uncharacterized membrane protein
MELSPKYNHPLLNGSAKKALLLICLIHAAGLIGLLLPQSRELFQKLTPFSLWTSTFLLILFQQDLSKTARYLFFISFFTGFFIEVLGVKTGIIFGNYEYGPTLGIKVLDVPLVIGANWLLMVVSTGFLSSKLKTGFLLKSLLGALLMVGFDWVMEPVAVKLDFWYWEGGNIPVQNYAGWFLVAFALQILYHKLPFKKYNYLAGWLFPIQLLFFVVLNLTLAKG